MNAQAVPSAFRGRFAEHNRHVIMMAFLTAVFAIFCWVLAYGFLYWIILFLGTIKKGDQMLAPHWVTPFFFAAVALLLLFAALDHAFFRYERPGDRPILGAHLFKDVLLALPRLTFAVFGNFMAYRRLEEDDLHRAWMLLERIHSDRKSDFFTLSQVEPDSRRLNGLLFALQLTDFIDLHQGQESWFYTIRSDQLEIVNEMIKIEDGVSPENVTSQNR